MSLYTMEAEFALASHVRRELLGLREMLKEIGLYMTEPMSMLCDNQAAIKQFKCVGIMSNTKHVDLHMKFICHDAKRGIVKPEFMESKLMEADLLTENCRHPQGGGVARIF